MTETISAAAVVQSWVNATNASDNAAMRALFERSAIVSDTGRAFAGIDAIMRWSDNELIGAGAKITVDRIEPDPGGAVLYSHVRSEGFSGSARVTFTVENGLIRRVDI